LEIETGIASSTRNQQRDTTWRGRKEKEKPIENRIHGTVTVS
jgi:hypothetical protein